MLCKIVYIHFLQLSKTKYLSSPISLELSVPNRDLLFLEVGLYSEVVGYENVSSIL